MTNKSAASIRDRLLNLAKKRKENFDFVLNQYAIQRLLYRLSISEYRDQFLLKGAWLFSIWTEESHRPTRDADFLGFCNNEVEALVEIFRSICSVQDDDGLEFATDTINGVEIKEDAIYQGVRIKGYAYLAGAKISIQIDVAYGDVVTPGAETAEMPVYLDMPAPKLNVYPVYTVISEKFQAMVALGLANSRMKDFYDIWRVSQMMELNGDLMAQAIGATFKRRNTKLEGDKLYIFSDEFRRDDSKQKQWQAFFIKNGLDMTVKFHEVMEQLEYFLGPVARAALENANLYKTWSPYKEEWIAEENNNRVSSKVQI